MSFSQRAGELLFGMERSARSRTNRIIQAKGTRAERARSRTNGNQQEEGRQREKRSRQLENIIFLSQLRSAADKSFGPAIP